MGRDPGSHHSSAAGCRFALAWLLTSVFLLIAFAPSAPADTVGVPIAVSGTAGFTGVACPTATLCEAVADSGGLGETVVPITNGAPGTPIPLPGIYEIKGVACQSTTNCIAVGNTASNSGVVVPITSGAPGIPVTVPGTMSIDAIACQGATSCMAVGDAPSLSPVVVPITNATPGTPVTVPGIQRLYAVACQSATSCVAVGSSTGGVEGAVVPIANGVPGTPVTVPGTNFLNGVACQSATSCTGTGFTKNNAGVVVPITDGTPGARILVLEDAGLQGIACESPANCEAVGEAAAAQQGVVVPIPNGRPGFPVAAPGSFTRPTLNAVACVSATICEAVGTSGYNGLAVSVCRPANQFGCSTLSGRPKSSGAIVSDKVKCHGSPGQRCVITEQLITGKQVVAAETITIKARRTTRATIKLDGVGRRLLKRLGKLRVTLTLSLARPAPHQIFALHQLTLTPPKH